MRQVSCCQVNKGNQWVQLGGGENKSSMFSQRTHRKFHNHTKTLKSDNFLIWAPNLTAQSMKMINRKMGVQICNPNLDLMEGKEEKLKLKKRRLKVATELFEFKEDGPGSNL